MRKNVLFIANFNHILKGTNAILAKTFNMQMCPPEPGMFERTLSVMEADLALWYISGLSYTHLKNMCDTIKRVNFRGKLAVFGTPEECEDFRNSFQIKVNVALYIHRPISPPSISDLLAKALDINTDIEEVPDKEPDKAPDETPKMSLSDFAASLEEDKRRCILLVDDDGRILRAMKMLLEKDYRVNVANSAKSALESIGRERPDAVLLDYEMPECDGKRALEIIRGFDRTKDLPVFFLTGVSDKDRIREVLLLKPQGYFLKNSEQSVILGALEKFFQNN